MEWFYFSPKICFLRTIRDPEKDNNLEVGFYF